MAEGKSVVRRVHDATCPGAIAKIKPIQRLCPLCTTADESAAE